MMLALALAAGVAVAGVALAQPAPVSPKAASAATKAANQQVQTLPFSDKSDFDDAKRGFMGAPETLEALGNAGRMRMRMGYCGNISPSGSTSPNIRKPSSTRSRGASTNDRERRCTTKRQHNDFMKLLRRRVESAVVSRRSTT